MKAATGIVNVNFKNSDGHEVDILKEFCEEEEE